MGKLEWNEGNLPALKKLFLMRVRNNMRAGSTVRFGLTGNGSNPNYEIVLSSGLRLAYNGLSHDRDSRADVFEENNISQPFALDQIEEAIAKARSAATGS